MLRRMFPRRAVVVVATGTLAITGAVVLTAPAAQATVVEYTSECVNDFIGSVGEVPSKYDVTVSPVKDKYAVGEQVKIDWKWITYPKVPDRSPLETLPENSTQPFGDIALSERRRTPCRCPARRNTPLRTEVRR